MPTLDGKEVRIAVDQVKCTACGLCVKVCPCEYLALEDKKVIECKDPAMGCLTCAQCAAICPTGALVIESEGLNREDVFEFSGAKPPSYDELFRLLAGRRSIRQFTDAPVPKEFVDRILEAAQQAPAGLPPSTVRCVVIHDKCKVRTFAFDFLDEISRMAWMFSKTGVWVLRPFMSAEYHREMREKVAPIYRGLIAGRKQDQDFLLYDAPLAMIFLSAGDPVDAAIACTYAMVTAEALGLGSCMIGTVTPMLLKTSHSFRTKHHIPEGLKDGLAIVFGTSKFKFQRVVRRRFAAVIPRPATGPDPARGRAEGSQSFYDSSPSTGSGSE